MRRRLGKTLARNHPVVDKDGDKVIVISVPDSSNTTALGYQSELEKQGINSKLEIGLIRSHYIGRTFIQPGQANREIGVRIKFNTVKGVLEGRTIVVIDDSIVRGTTLKKSIIKMLDRLQPRKIIIVSSAPQIRYPDCYGIDMARLGDFIAFQGAVGLLKERGMTHILDTVYKKCKDQADAPKEHVRIYVKEVYEPFTAEEISKKIAELVTPEDIHASVDVIFQTLEGLHEACPNHHGDWYFSGNYPTPGGNAVVNKKWI